MKKKSTAKMMSCTSRTTRPSVRDIKIGMRISITSPRQMGKVDRHQPATLSASPTITVDGVPDKTVGKRSAGRSVHVIRHRGIINSGVFVRMQRECRPPRAQQKVGPPRINGCSTLNGKATVVYNATAGKWVVGSGDRRDKVNRIG
ncbi:hypothetical protein B0H14DRAFT_3137381 [Mycena olivaceomarginata]|nr:hypothetical protein B0H14DRAFT_3137381 [Mycena olivaceomarginata]